MKTMIMLNNDRRVLVDSPTEYLLERLLEKKEELGGKYPTVPQIIEDKEMPTQAQYAYYFKNYEILLKEANIYERAKLGTPKTATVKLKYRK